MPLILSTLENIDRNVGFSASCNQTSEPEISAAELINGTSLAGPLNKGLSTYSVQGHPIMADAALGPHLDDFTGMFTCVNVYIMPGM